MAERHAAESARASREESAQLERVAWLANAILPAGWLPLGVKSAAEGRVWPSLLGLLGMTLIGSASLGLAFRSTIAQFQGRASGRKPRAMVERRTSRPGRGTLLVEARIPGLSEPVAAIALGTLRSLLRSPEAKISLLTPLIMGGVFGSMLLRGGAQSAELLRPLYGIAAIAFVLFGLLQIMGNQFGVDRDGFRVFVLCAAPRHAILLGKNLAYAPAAVLLSTVLLVVIQVLSPMRVDLALAMIPQFISMYLLFCLMANLFSIYAPVFVAAGTLKPANPKMSTVLLQIVMFLVLFPVTQGATLIPLGVEAGLAASGRSSPVPICLLLTLLECAIILVVYRFSLGWLGDGLQAREQRILETVTNRAL